MLPKIPDVNGSGAIPQDEWLKLLVSLREDYAINVSLNQIALGLKKNIPSATNEVFEKFDNAFIRREAPNYGLGLTKFYGSRKYYLSKGGLQGRQTVLSEEGQESLTLLTCNLGGVLKPSDTRAITNGQRF